MSRRRNPYGTITEQTVERLLDNSGLRFEDVWPERAAVVYSDAGSAAQQKGCPKAACAGLWADHTGATVGAGGPNAQYAVATLQLIRQNPAWADLPPTVLWERLREVRPDLPQQHNGQMNVVLAFYRVMIARGIR